MKKKVALGAAVVTFFLALLITLYPLISTAYNRQHQSQIHLQHLEQVEQADNQALEAAWELAEAYNAALVPGVQDLERFTPEQLEAAAEGYKDLLDIAGDGILCYVTIPKLDACLPVYHGTSDDVLELGLGHLLGTSLPIGGSSSHSVLTGHSGLASQRLLSDLDQLEPGDVFYIEVLDKTLAYEVDQMKTVLPYETEDLQIIPGQDYCTLVTCTPFGVNTHRLLVRGTRIPCEEAEEIAAETVPEEHPVSTWEQEYWKGLSIGLGAVALTGLAALGFWTYRRCRRESS